MFTVHATFVVVVVMMGVLAGGLEVVGGAELVSLVPQLGRRSVAVIAAQPVRNRLIRKRISFPRSTDSRCHERQSMINGKLLRLRGLLVTVLLLAEIKPGSTFSRTCG
ncbi:hypothetical protein ACQPZ2_30830 [Nocardia pseudovaccinii]|uniref:hypothetical protein n=1 Tax=Nocardia pseudovaccinii TaxID=189540 RepID=UPI003D8C309B